MRIECISGSLAGLQGKVLGRNKDMHGKTKVCVEFDNFVNGHGGSGGEYNGRFGHCWWLSENKLKGV